MSVRSIALTFVCLTLIIASGCAQSAREQKSGQPVAPPGKAATEGAAGAKLEITDLATGTGAVAESGKSVTVHYRGTLADGTEFDSSQKHGEPFTFRLGAGKVIPGWDEGVKGMKVGGKRKLVVPPSMAYGEEGFGGVIPPNATLTFEVELLKVGAE